MEFEEVIKKRRSVRSFDPEKEITDKQLKEILEAGRAAPSAGNSQPWRFIVVEDKGIKKELAEACFSQGHIAEAPKVIIVAIDIELAYEKYGQRGCDLYAIQSTAAAAENMFLEAVNLGLGACWVGGFDEKKIAELCDLDHNFRPVIILPIGHPKEKPQKSSRKSLDEITDYID